MNFNSNEAVKPPLVVYVCNTPNARMSKMAAALRARGWDVTLLYIHRSSFDLGACFTQTIACTSPAHLVWMATRLRPIVFHVFDSWRLEVAQRLLSHRPGKMIIDIYDVMTGTSREAVWPKRDSYLEQMCLEGYDGICARSLTVQIPKRLGYRLTKNVLFFPDYCKAEVPALKPKHTDGLHVVFVGTVPAAYIYDRHGFGCCDMDFIRSLTARGIHYHLYPFISDAVEKRYAPYLELAAVNPFFHFHRPLKHDELLAEISQYHLGIMAVSEETLRIGDWTFNELTHRYFIPNKVFDYLDANLGLLLYGGRTVNWLMERTGTALIMSRDKIMEDSGKTLCDFAYDPTLAGKIARARDQFAINRHTERLERFYFRVAGTEAPAHLSGGAFSTDQTTVLHR